MKSKVQLIVIILSSAFYVGKVCAAPAVNLNQGRNGVDTMVVNPMQWINGNLGGNGAHYNEEMSTPFQCVFTGLTPGVAGTIVIGYDIMQGGKHAYDYLTYYTRILPHNFPTHNTPETINPLTGSGLPVNTPFSTYPIPVPSAAGSPIAGQPVTSFLTLATSEREMVIYNGTIDTIYYVSQGSLTASVAETRVAVTFTPSSSTVVLLWGGHIGSRNDWGYSMSGPNSAAGISGSPFHMRLVSWTLANVGNQDRSLGGTSVGAPPPPPLPVTLVCLVGENTPHGNLLQWATASEINNDYFTIERSQENENFQSIGTVDGAGNSNSFLTYSWTDAAPANGVNYYRVEQTDFDGNHQSYGPICVRAGDKPFSLSLINIYPNPSTGDFYLTYRAEDRGETLMEILNAEGKKVYSEILNSVRGTNFIEIKNSLLPTKGVYFVRLSQGKVKSHAERIVKK